MLLKNNYKERLRKMEPKKDRFSIRKLSIGAASVLIGSVFIGMSNGETVEAQDLNPDNGNDAKSADKTDSKATEVPEKVVVTTTLNPKDFNDPISTQKNIGDSKVEDHHKDKTSLQDASQAAQVKVPVEKTSDNAKTQTSSTEPNKQAKAETVKQNKKSTTNQISQSTAQAEFKKSAASVQRRSANAVASESAKAVENSIQTPATSAFAQTATKDIKGGSKDIQLPSDITAKNASVTTENLKDYQTYMDNLEKNFSLMSKENQTAALNDAKKKFDLLSKADQLVLSNQVLAISDNLNSDYTVDKNGVANISTYGQFSKAFVDSNVKTMNLTADIDFTGLKEQKGLVGVRVTGEDADIQDGLYTGGISGGWDMSALGFQTTGGLGAYELGTAHNATDPYPNAPRTLTIEGNNHKLDMGKWWISLWDKGDKGKWDLHLNDLTINSDYASHSPFYFYQAATAIGGAQGGNITYKNVTANIKNAPLIDYGKTATAATQEPVNITFEGNNTINSFYADDKAINAYNLNLADNASLNLNLTGSTTNAIQFDKSFITGKNATVNIKGDVPTFGIISIDAGSVNFGGANKVNISAQGADISTFNGDVNFGQNSTVNLTNITNDSMDPGSAGNWDSSNPNLGLPGINLDISMFKNNAVTFGKELNIGNGTTLNFNTGDAAPAAIANTRSVRGFFSGTQDSKVTIGSNTGKLTNNGAKVNMNMGYGHSSAVEATNLDITDGSSLIINTNQDNNNIDGVGKGVWGALSGNQSWAYPDAVDYCHRSVIALAERNTATLGHDGDNTELHVTEGSKLKITRGVNKYGINIVPLISFGNSTSNRFYLRYDLKVDKGATLDLQDAVSSKGIKGFDESWDNYLGSADDVARPALITMYGTDSTDNIQFGSADKNGKYLAPAYVNLQRTGDQYGYLVILEGKAIPGKLSLDPSQWFQNIQNKVLINGQAPVAQWNSNNTTDTPDYAWNVKNITFQNGGGNTSANYVPIKGKGLTADGFSKNPAIRGITLGLSNGSVSIPGEKEDEYTTYNDGVIEGSKTNLVELQNLLDNFNMWKSRRFAYGSKLASADSPVPIPATTKYMPVVSGITRTEGEKLNSIKDLSPVDQQKIIPALNDLNGEAYNGKLSDQISQITWGIDWSKTAFKNLLNANGQPDATKLNNLLKSTSDSKTDFDNSALLNGYAAIVSQLNYADGSKINVEKSKETDSDNSYITKVDGVDDAKFLEPLKLSDSSKNSQVYNIPVTVLYKDGKADIEIVPVTVNKKQQKDEYQPKYQTTAVKQGTTATVTAPTFMSQTPNADGGYEYKDLTSALQDVTYSITKDATKPDFITLNSDGSITISPTTTDNIGIYTIPVTVTYSDKSTDNISALVNVTDGKSKVIWGKINPDGTISGAVVVKPSDGIEAHKTTNKSMSFDESDTQKSVGEIDVYSPDSKDATKLSSPVQYTYDETSGDFVNSSTKLGANIRYENSPDTTVNADTTTGKVIVQFSNDSEPVKDGVIDNGTSATITSNVKLVGATVANPLTPITILKNDYALGAIAKFLSSDKVAGLINHADLDTYSKNHSDNEVTSYEVLDPDSIDTKKVGTRDVTVRIHFKDNTYLDLPVKAAIKIADGEDAKYQPSYDSVVSADQKDIISTLPTWDKNGKPTDGATYQVINGNATVNNDGVVTIPASSLTDTGKKTITVKVTYKDGTYDDVFFTAYEVKSAGLITDPYSARDAISNANNLPDNTEFKWETAPDPHISTPQSLAVDVTIEKKTVKVPVIVTLTKTVPDNTTKVYSDDITASIIVETPDYHKTTGSNIPVAPKVSEIDLFDETGKQVKKYILSNDGTQYIDGAGDTLVADALSTKWADGYTLDTDSNKFDKDGTATTIAESNDEKDTTQNSKYRVIFHWNSDAASIIGIPAPSVDNDTNYSNVYANIYGAKAAEANKDNNNLEVTHNVDSALKDATNYVDSTDLTKEHNAEVNAITWKIKPDITKLGKQDGIAEISFKDGTVLDVPVSITVNKSQADDFNDKNTDTNPLTHELSYGKGATVPATDAIKGIGTKNETPESLNITDTKFNDSVLTDQDHVGKDTDYYATVVFKDGSTTVVEIPVMITDQAITNVPVAKNTPVKVDQGSIVDPSSIINTDKSTLPKNTTEKWTIGPDTSKPGTQSVTISLTYPDGTTGTLDGKVTVEATPTTQTIQLKQGVTATNTDAITGITNLDTKGADGMPKSVVWTSVPSTDKAGVQDATVDITYADGYQKKNVAVKVNVWATKKGIDETEPTDPDYKNMVKKITRTITVDGAKPIVQTVTFTRDKYTDTTKTSDNVIYGVWTTDDPTFEETTELSKDGYTTVVNGKDTSGKDYTLTDKGTIAAETIKAPTAANTDWNPVNETITVINKANEQTVNISYTDKKTGKEVSVTPAQKFTGNTDAKVTITKSEDSKSFKIGDTTYNAPEGYKIDKDGLVTSYLIPAKNGKLTVTIDKLTTLNPGTDVDPKNPGENSDMFETITRTINYTDPTTNKAVSEKQYVKYQRTKTTNEDDLTDISYGKWELMNGQIASWSDYVVKTFDDLYKITASGKDSKGKDVIIADKDGKKIIAADTPSVSDDSTINNVNITLTYTRTEAGKFVDDNKNNAATQTILVHQTKTNDPSAIVATNGIKKSDDYKLADKAPVVWKDATRLPDTSVVTPADDIPTYAAAVTFSDGSTIDVNIPIKIWNDASKFNEDDTKNPLTQEVDINKGISTPKGSNALAGFNSDTQTKYEIKSAVYNEYVDTSKSTDTTTPYDVDVVFGDGSEIKTGVTVPVKIVAKGDAANFDHDNGDTNALVHELSYGKGYSNGALALETAKDGIGKTAADNIKTISDYNIDKVVFNETVLTNTSHAAENQSATITFKDGATSVINIPVEITDEASENDKNIVIKTSPVQTDQGKSVDASALVDTDKTMVPEGTKYVFGKSADFNTPGTQNVTIIAHYPDGTVGKEIAGKITVEATPMVQTITLKQGIAATADDVKTAIGNLTGKDGYPASVAWTTDAPSTDKVGKVTVNVTITYADAYVKKIDVPVNVLETIHGSKGTPKDPDGNDIYKEVTRNVSIDGESQPTQTITFTRDAYIDTQNGNKITGYSDWVKSGSFKAVNVHKDGYASIVKLNGKDVSLTNETIPAEDKITVDSPSENYVVTHTANADIVEIQYVDAKDKTTKVTDDTPGDAFNGTTGQKITIAKDQLTVPTGYKLNDNLNGDYTYTFGTDEKQTKIIYVDRLTSHNPEDSDIDPTGKDSDMFENITRTIIVKNPQTGKDDSITQTIHLQRTKTINETTGKVDHYGKWTFMDTTQTWPELNVPQFDGMYSISAVDDKGNAVDVSSKKIDAKSFDPSDEKNIPSNTTITISYSRTDAGKFTDDNKDNAQVQTILVKQNTDPATIDAKKGIKEKKDYTIDSVTFVDPTKIDTKTIATKNYTAVVTFGDKSTVKVSIPVKVWNDASKFDENNSKSPLTQVDNIKQSTSTPAGSIAKNGFSDEVWKNYDIKSAMFDKDVDTSKVTADITPYDVTVTFNDGTTTKVQVPVKIVSGDATKFDHDNTDSTNPDNKDLLAQIIRVKQDTDAKTITAETGIKNANQYDIKSVTFDDISKIDTSNKAAGKEIPYAATVFFNDGTQSSINIPIYVYNDAVNYHDDHKDPTDPTKVIATNPIHENMGTQVPATDAAKGLTADEISKYGITTDGENAPKFNNDIDTSKVDQTGKNYAATLHFADGSGLTDVQIKVLIDNQGDAAHFNNDNKDNVLVKRLTWGKGTSHQASEAINSIKDPRTYNVTSATFTALPSTDKVHPAQNFEATVSFKDGTSLKVQLPVAITDQAHDTTVETQPIHIPVSQGKTPEVPNPHKGIKDPDKLPDGTMIEWTDKTPVIPDPGKTPTNPEITVTYPDGTKKTVNSTVDSVWVPVVGKLTTKLNETPDLTNNDTDKQAIINFGQGAGYPKTLTWVTKPNVTKAGLVNSTIHVAYDDGYEVDVTVPVNVLDVKKGSDETNPTDPDYNNMVKKITRKITVDGGTPIVQTVTFIRDKYTDTTKTINNVTYGIWTTDNPTFAETTKLSKDGYTATLVGKDAQGNDYKLTDKGTIAAETIKAPTIANTDWNPTNETITVTNKANYQTVTLNFVDAKDGKIIVGHQDLSGVTDQVFSIDPAKLTLPDSYKLDKNYSLPTSYTFKSSGNDPITILVDHLTTIKPSDVDPKNPGKNSDMFETITRKFQINGVTQDQVAPISDQSVNFQRTKTVNDDDSTDMTYGEWTPVNEGTTGWKAVNVTKLNHYNVVATQNGNNIDITSGKIAAETVEANGDNPTKDTTIILTYSLDQSGQFQHDMDHDALVNTIRVKKGISASEVKANDGVDKQAQYHITGVTWSKDVQIDTSTTGTTPYAAGISFEDGSSLKVQIPVKVYDRASDFEDDWNSDKITPIPVAEHMGIAAPKTDAFKGFSDDTKSKYGIVAKDSTHITEFTNDVPVNKVQETKVQAQVVFDDGSVASIYIPVDIQGSQASDFLNNDDAKVQTVEETYNSTVNKHDAFTKGLVDARRDYVTDANFVQNIDTTQKDTTQNYRAKLEFEDGSTVEVMIPVKIVTDAEKFNDANKDNALVKGLEVKVGDTVNKTDAINSLSEVDPKNPIMDKAEFEDTVTTDQAGTNDYRAIITFKDGSNAAVTIPVTVGNNDASRFNPTTDLQPIEVHKGYTITLNDHDADAALKNTPEGTHAQFEDPSAIDTNVPGTTKHDVTVTFPDGSKKEHVSVEVHIYTDSDKFDYTKNIKPITIPHGTTIAPKNPNNAKDAVVDSNGVVASVKYADSSTIDTSVVGDIEYPKIIITFKDGSTHTSKVPVTIVNNDADNFNSSNLRSITVGEGDKLPADPKSQVIDPDGKNVANVTYNKDNDSDVTKTSGEKQIKVDITFKDGSTKTLPITVVVSDKGTLTKYEPGKSMVDDEFDKYITRTIEEINPLNNKVDYIVQTIHFVREDKDGNAAYTDSVSGKKTYVPWVIMDKNGKLTNRTNGVWKEISEKELDSFDGYKPSITDFAEAAVTPDTKSEEDEVTYAVDFSAVSLLFANQKVDTGQSVTFMPVLISKQTGKHLDIPAGQLLYSFDENKLSNLPQGAKVEAKTGQITVPAGQLAKLYNMSLIARNTAGDTAPVVASLDVTKSDDGKQTEDTGSTTPNTKPDVPTDNTGSTGKTPTDNTGSTTSSQLVTPTQTDSDNYDPIGQDIITTPGVLPDPTDAIKNKNQMPSGTVYTWKTDPNVDTAGTANGTVVVKFNDGSTRDVNVQINVKNDEETSDTNEEDASGNETSHVKHIKPIIVHLTVKKGHLPEPEDLVKNMDDMPEGTEVYWIKKPNVHKAGQQEGIIGIKYSDGTRTKKSFFITVKPGNSLSSSENQDSNNSPHSEDSLYNNLSRLGNSSNSTAPKDELASIGALGQKRMNNANSIDSASDYNKTRTLPDTGAKTNEATEVAGLAALGLGMVGLAGVKKRRKYN